MHPPKLNIAKAAPEIEPLYHLKATRCHQERGNARLPDEAPLHGFQQHLAISGHGRTADHGQNHGRNHRDPADPYDYGKNMNRPSNRKIVHNEHHWPSVRVR